MKDTIFKQSENFVSRQLGEETVLVPINQTGAVVQRVFALNSTAAAIWEKTATALSFEELIKLLKSEYTADEKVIRIDVENLLEDFLQTGLIEETTR